MLSHLALATTDQESDFEMMRTQLCLEGTAAYHTVNILTVLLAASFSVGVVLCGLTEY